MWTRVRLTDCYGGKLANLNTEAFNELHIFEDSQLKLAISKSEGEFVIYKDGVELTNDTLTRNAKERLSEVRG